MRLATPRSVRARSPGQQRGLERDRHRQPAGRDLRAARREHVPGDGGEVDGDAAVEAALPPRQRQQRLEQPFLFFPGDEHPAAGGAQRLGVRAGVAERDFEHGPRAGERRAQLVRGVGDELPLRAERRVQAAEEIVDRVRQFAQVVIRLPDRQPLVQVRGGDPLRGGGDPPQRAQRAAGREPAERHRHDRHDPQRDA